MNRLADETSPYLRQHAHNPVDWFPWGEEAFARARAKDRPVLLSVGYSSCHWCHVMAHESFEDEATAASVNRRFVAVKVDREERPDVDAVYMEAVQAMTGGGGWPMTVFLTPDGRPFFGGTYFPPADRRGMPGFIRVLDAVDDAWRNRRAEVEQQADQLAEAIARRAAAPTSLGGTEPAPAGDDTDLHRLSGQLLHRAVDELAGRFDATWGGFGGAPKFPQPALVELCLRHHRLAGDERSLTLATTTLAAMAAGGIYDHLGGGFARYSTDVSWTVPHFEKMLYDQAGLVRVYLHAWQGTGQPQWLQVVEETVGYVLRDLALVGGGLASSEDADSEGVEGRFYLWEPAELRQVLGEELGAVAAGWYGVDDGPNFEGRSILRRPVAGPWTRPAAVEQARRLLLEARSTRVRPGLDDKVLTEWNAMFCSALCEAAAATGRPQWARAAVDIGSFLWEQLRRDGRYLRSWQGGQARHLAYAADHAWVVDAFTRLGELTGQRRWLERAVDSADDLLRLFGSDDGLLFTTGSDAESLVVRPVDVLDGAAPSANSVAAAALVRLGVLAGNERHVEAGQRLLQRLVPVAQHHPLAMANLVGACALAHGGTTEVVVAGQRPDLVDVVRRRYEPTAVLAWGERTGSPLWQGRRDGQAYVCRRFVCQAPADSAEQLQARLDAERQADAATLGGHLR